MTHGLPKAPLERQPIFWFYGSAAMAYGIKNNAFSYLLLIYANQVLDLPGYLAAIALAVAMLWDAVSDLLLGHWSDKTSSRYGRRHPFMYAGFIVLPLCFFALFNPVIELNESNTFLYVLATALLIRTGTTLFEVPSTALLPDLEKDYDRRNRWLALRHGFGWYGGNGIHTINFFFWIGAYGVTAQTGYSIYGTVGALIIAGTILMSSLGTQKAAAALPRPADTFKFGEISREIRQIFQSVRNRNFAALFFYGLAIGVASGLGTALYLYNTTYFFGFSGAQIATTGIFVLLSPLLAYWVVPRVGSRFGKKNAAIGAILANISLYPIPYILLLNGFWPALGTWVSLGLYSAFIVAEVFFCDHRRRAARLDDGRRRGGQRSCHRTAFGGSVLCGPRFCDESDLRGRHHRRRHDRVCRWPGRYPERRAGHRRDSHGPGDVFPATVLRPLSAGSLVRVALPHRPRRPRRQSGSAGGPAVRNATRA